MILSNNNICIFLVGMIPGSVNYTIKKHKHTTIYWYSPNHGRNATWFVKNYPKTKKLIENIVILAIHAIMFMFLSCIAPNMILPFQWKVLLPGHRSYIFIPVFNLSYLTIF